MSLWCGEVEDTLRWLFSLDCFFSSFSSGEYMSNDDIIRLCNHVRENSHLLPRPKLHSLIRRLKLKSQSLLLDMVCGADARALHMVLSNVLIAWRESCSRGIPFEDLCRAFEENNCADLVDYLQYKQGNGEWHRALLLISHGMHIHRCSLTGTHTRTRCINHTAKKRRSWRPNSQHQTIDEVYAAILAKETNGLGHGHSVQVAESSCPFKG